MSCQESWQMTNLPEQMKAGVISQKGKTILRLNKIIDKLRSTLIQGFFFLSLRCHRGRSHFYQPLNFICLLLENYKPWVGGFSQKKYGIYRATSSPNYFSVKRTDLHVAWKYLPLQNTHLVFDRCQFNSLLISVFFFSRSSPCYDVYYSAASDHQYTICQSNTKNMAGSLAVRFQRGGKTSYLSYEILNHLCSLHLSLSYSQLWKNYRLWKCEIIDYHDYR